RLSSNFSQLPRKEKAYGFYRNSGFDANKSLDHMRGIDFNHEVDIVQIPKGTEMTQYQIPGARLGSYYAQPGTPGNTLGFYTSGREVKTYIANSDISALRSTASSTIDDWSMKAYGWKIEAPGGGTQFFTTSQDWIAK
uniref:polymorphic toxin type 46 domain-containing protein n=1 Tax=Limnobacter sp. TaxID=2003368 RepID=UPI002584C942